MTDPALCGTTTVVRDLACVAFLGLATILTLAMARLCLWAIRPMGTPDEPDERG